MRNQRRKREEFPLDNRNSPASSQRAEKNDRGLRNSEKKGGYVRAIRRFASSLRSLRCSRLWKAPTHSLRARLALYTCSGAERSERERGDGVQGRAEPARAGAVRAPTAARSIHCTLVGKIMRAKSLLLSPARRAW